MNETRMRLNPSRSYRGLRGLRQVKRRGSGTGLVFAMPMARSIFLQTALFLLSLVSSALCLGAERPLIPVPPDLLTQAELTGFRKTQTYDEVVAVVTRLERLSPYLRVSFIGPSEQGRRIPVVVASKEKLFEPAERFKSAKPVVLVLNSIHAGEVDGTDATLILLRDIALTNRLTLLDGVTLVTVVVYNVDGHARVSPYNRPNQNGPEEMGTRPNARGLDLNRDFVKADAPETRALLA